MAAEAVQNLPTGIRLAAFLLVAYIVGIVAVGLTESLFLLVWRTFRHRVANFARKKSKRRLSRWVRQLALKFVIRMGAETHTSRNLVLDYLAQRFATIGAPPNLALSFPPDVILSRLAENDVQLRRSSSPLSEEYDRLTSQVELRLGLCPALVTLGAVCTLEYFALLGSLVIIVGVVVPYQAIRDAEHVRKMLATAVAQGLIRALIFDSIVNNLAAEKNRGKLTNPAEWLANAILALADHGQFQAADDMLAEVRLREEDKTKQQVIDILAGSATYGDQARES